MKVENLSKNTRQIIWDLAGNMKNIKPLREIVEEMKTEEEILEQLAIMSIKEDELVWYVCYGSNLAIERLRCYFTGKENEEVHIKAREKNKFRDYENFDPIDVREYTIPYKLYFANNVKSSNWEYSGVCFLDLSKTGKTIGRAYLMHKYEYDHLYECEGKSINWYDREKLLGYIDGKPVLTFTNKGHVNEKDPCQAYIDVMKIGLKQMNKSEKEIEDYLHRIQRKND